MGSTQLGAAPNTRYNNIVIFTIQSYNTTDLARAGACSHLGICVYIVNVTP